MLEIIHRIPTNEHLRLHTKNILSVMFRFLEVFIFAYGCVCIFCFKTVPDLQKVLLHLQNCWGWVFESNCIGCASGARVEQHSA